MVKFTSAVAAMALAAPFVAAQTFSDCDPTKTANCPAKPGLNRAEYSVDFTKGASTLGSDWKTTSGTVGFAAEGAEFTIKQLGDGPTMQTNWYIFFGYVEVVMQAAPGAGIVSSFVMESDDLDEIDWEIIGSQTTQVQSNYFGKGNTTTYDRGQFHPVTNPQTTMVKYAVNWTSTTTTWLINDKVVRTLNFADAVGGKNYPQTPMNIRLGNWVAGDPKNAAGTIQWAGGLADFSKAPFNMFIESVKVINYNPAGSYSFKDQSGSFESITISSISIAGTSSGTSSGSSSGSKNGTTTGNTTAKTTTTTRKTGTTSTKRSGTTLTRASTVTRANTGTRLSQPTAAAASGIKTVTINPQGSGSGSSGSGSSGSGSSSNGTAVVAQNGGGQTVTINPGSGATGAPSNGGSSFQAGPMGTMVPSNSTGSSGGGIVNAGSPSNGTLPTFTVNVAGGGSGAPASAPTATAAAGAAISGSQTMSFALGGNGTATAGPAKQTTNSAVRKTGSTGALAVGLVVLVLSAL